MIVIFDRQHYGKPGRNDMGAGYDLDGDGNIELQERETQLTPLYYLPAKEILEEMGHRVFIIDSGWYSARHKQANQIARDNPHDMVAYIACHVNAGQGDYAVAIHDANSRFGKSLARSVAQHIRDYRFNGILRSLVREGASDNNWSRGYSTIKGIAQGPGNIAGLCFEPYFIDRRSHAWLATPQGGQQIGSVLANALMAWDEELRS